MNTCISYQTQIISTSTNISSSILLKEILSISNESVSSSQSPTSVVKKSFSPEPKFSQSNNINHLSSSSSSTSSSSKKNKKRTSPPPLYLPPSSTMISTHSNYFYAGSDFMNSPDPNTIPIPNFDDVDDFFIPSSSYSNLDSNSNSGSNPNSLKDKTSTLRRILQVK
mmetsp:Transcript_2886/g.2877  ORF Transcript_2886/g.2877 Transcript_2886/m.2877 type:complete len:167 (+) Transcript_2886:61-561(+)